MEFNSSVSTTPPSKTEPAIVQQGRRKKGRGSCNFSDCPSKRCSGSTMKRTYRDIDDRIWKHDLFRSPRPRTHRPRFRDRRVGWRARKERVFRVLRTVCGGQLAIETPVGEANQQTSDKDKAPTGDSSKFARSICEGEKGFDEQKKPPIRGKAGRELVSWMPPITYSTKFFVHTRRRFNRRDMSDLFCKLVFQHALCQNSRELSPPLRCTSAPKRIISTYPLLGEGGRVLCPLWFLLPPLATTTPLSVEFDRREVLGEVR